MFDKALEAVLEKSKYDYLTGRKIRMTERIYNLALDILEWIFDKLNFSFEFSDKSMNTDLIVGVFYISATLITILLIAVFLYYFLKRRKRRAAFDEIFAEFKNNKLTFNELTALSESCEAQKNYRDALRYQYIGLILIISNKNIIQIPDSMTGNQFLRQVKAKAPDFTDGVSSTVSLYNILYFGRKQVSDEVYGNHKTKYNDAVRRAQSYEQKN